MAKQFKVERKHRLQAVAIAKAYLKKGEQEKGMNYLKILCSQYPDAPEYQTATALSRQFHKTPR